MNISRDIQKQVQEIDAIMDNAIKNFNKEATTMNNSTENKEATAMNNSTENKETADTKSTKANNGKDASAGINYAALEEEAMKRMKSYGNKRRRTSKKNDSTSKNSKAEAVDTETQCNLAEMIPDDEQAITELDIIKRSRVVVVDSIEPLSDITSEIPENEREETELLPVALEDIKKCGCFLPITGMKGLVTDTGHKFWAKLCIEPKKGHFIKYCQQYKDNTYSEQMIINKADLANAAICHFLSNKTNDISMKNSVAKFILEASKDYYGKLLYLKEGLDIVSILIMFMKECDNLPKEIEQSVLEQPDRLYPNVIKIIKDKELDIVDEHEAYYTLDKDQIETLAYKLNVKKKEMLKKFKEYGFLYLTDSSDGYQTCVRFKPCMEFLPTSHTQWCYCILKLDYLAKKRLNKAKE